MATSMEAPTSAVTLPALLTPSSLATLGGLATAVLIIVDSVHSATGWTSSWFGFVLALVLALIVEFTFSQATVGQPRVGRVALALINGCLVFTTALGGNQVGNRVAEARQPNPQAVQPTITLHPSASRTADRPFFHDWLQ